MASITIKDLREIPEIYFDELVVGDIFERYGEKIPLIKIGQTAGYNAVYLTDGTLGYVGDAEMVVPLEAELYIKNYKEN